MTKFTPLRDVPPPSRFKKGDLMVVFGELFARGYVNGIVDEAAEAGLEIIYSTVGRRDENNQLRPLTAEELAEKGQPIINVPLEAGFDRPVIARAFHPFREIILSGKSILGFRVVNIAVAVAQLLHHFGGRV